MKTAARVLLGLAALMLLYNGLAYMFVPEIQLGTTMIQPTGDGIFGMANIRANIGAPAVTFGILLAISAIRMEKAPVRVVIMFLVLSIIARIVGLIVGGIDADFLSIRIMVVLTVLLAITGFGYWTFQESDA